MPLRHAHSCGHGTAHMVVLQIAFLVYCRLAAYYKWTAGGQAERGRSDAVDWSACSGRCRMLFHLPPSPLLKQRLSLGGLRESERDEGAVEV